MAWALLFYLICFAIVLEAAHRAGPPEWND